MKRSQINSLMQETEALLKEYRFLLPQWAYWSATEWQGQLETAHWCRQHQMGWDITDFGANDFYTRGLILFCIRNGNQAEVDSMPYAEKIMVVREQQETPLHYHKIKMEDIIVRGGGNLVVELYNINDTGERLNSTVKVRIDGVPNMLDAGEPLILNPGQSITIPRDVYHRFYGEQGSGQVLVGEVSQVNDDNSDNYFFDTKARFSEIEEDEDPLYPLWHELPQA